MIRIVLSLTFLLVNSFLTAQITPTTQWVWVKGNNVLDQPGNYGVKGTFSPTNLPGSRDGLLSWKDAAGNFWIFGGNGYSAGPRGYLNDLWKYDQVMGQWQWVSGSDNINDPGDMSVFGTPDASVHPGARRYAVSWTDQLGRLWLFGGEGYTPNGFGLLNDLWMFDPSNSIWTWVGGSENPDQFTEFGIQGLPDPGNMPGSRYGAGSWVDNNGDLWLFGGLSYDSPTPSFSNELWHYDIVTGEWTWIKGTFVLNSGGTYGTQGVPSNSNSPGGRMDMVTWTDNSGKLWLFGGYGLDLNAGEGSMNDMWQFDLSTGNWTWTKGDNVVNQVGIYGTQGTSAVNNTPGARFQSYAWKDAFGTLWLYGGDGYGNAAQGLLSDLWKFETSLNRWTWVKGDGVVDRSTVYGSQGVSSPTNRPGGRRSGGVFSDAAGQIWLFGGNGYDASTNTDLLNDLWRLGSFAPVPVSALSLQANITEGKTQLEWYTLNEVNTSRYVIQRSSDGIMFREIITGNTAGSSGGRVDYLNEDQFPFNGYNYYRVLIYDIDGNISMSNTAFVYLNTIEVEIYPNPASDYVIIKSGVLGGNKTISLYDISGRLVETITATDASYTMLDLSKIPGGTYILKIRSRENTREKILVVR